MKKALIGFFCGILATLIPAAVSVFKKPHPTPLESSLAQILYEKLTPYENEVCTDRVLLLVNDLRDHKQPLKSEKELYEPLLSFEERKTEKEMAIILEKESAFLKRVSEDPHITCLIPDRVFIQVLQEGTGPSITADDAVTLYFKEYSSDGALLKDSKEAYTIPLSQTIKGFKLGMAGAKVGERRKIYLHPDYGFGKMGRKSPSRALVYEVTIVDKQ